MGRKSPSEAIWQEARMSANDLEAGRVQVLVDTSVGEDHSVVGEVEIFAVAVAEVGSHDRDPAAGVQAVTHLFQERRDRLLAWKVLEEIRDEYPVEVLAGQICLHDLGNDQAGVLSGYPLLVRHGIDCPPLLRWNGVDELAASSRRIEDALWAS